MSYANTKKTLSNTDKKFNIYDAYIRRGNFLMQHKNPLHAEKFFVKAHLTVPSSIDPIFKLGLIYYQLNKDKAAIKMLTQAYQIQPDDIEIINILGAAYGRIGEISKAIPFFKKACHLDPESAAAHLNCGHTIMATQNFAEAERWLTKASIIRPNHTRTLRLLAETRLKMGQPRAAIKPGIKAIEIDPNDMGSTLILGQTYMALQILEPAKELLELYVSKLGNDPIGLYCLAQVEAKIGRTEIAINLYKNVLKFELNTDFKALLQLRLLLTLPVINQSQEQIIKIRKIITNSLATLPRPSILDPHQSGAFANFFLAYQGCNDKFLQQEIAKFYLDCCPELGSDKTNNTSAPGKRKFKIAIVSSFLRNHTIGYLFKGLIQYLDRDRFEVYAIRCPIKPVDDPLTKEIGDLADFTVDLPNSIAKARDILAGVSADLIFYPEIGMEDFVYLLAFSRCALVQVMGWGHPVTSGIPNIDYFLSTNKMEPQDGQMHYSETLIELEGLSICVEKPLLPENSSTGEHFGFDTSKPIYLCAQSLFKIHPNFDKIVMQLLKQDEKGIIYFISINEHADRQFRNRLKSVLGSKISRTQILTRVHSKDFITLLSHADVTLDIPEWAGGKTSLESLAVGTPIVHWPGNLMRGRHTLALYQALGISDCIAKDSEQYVNIAYKIANDSKYRESLVKNINAKVDLLFNQKNNIDEISDVFEALIKESRQE